MQLIKIDLSGLSGLSPNYAKLPSNLNYFGEDTHVSQGSFNPFVYPGYLAPARSIKKTLTDGNTTVVSRTCQYDPITGKFIHGGARSSNGKAAVNWFSTLDSTTYNTAVELSPTGTIYDFEIYQLNGVRKLFFTTYDTVGANGYIGVHNFTYFTYNWSNGAAAADASLYTSTVTNPGTFSAPPFLRVATNGFMYAFVSNAVHKIDGTTAGGAAGTITANVLTLDANYKISDAVDWRNLMFMAVQDALGSAFGQPTDGNRYVNICGVFVWDRVSTQVGQRDFIPIYGIKYINRIFVSHDGKLRIICTGSDGYVQLREYNGSSFDIIAELGTNSAPLFWDSLTISNYATFWLGQDNYIYAHGKPLTGLKNNIYKLGQITSSAIPSGYHGFLYYANNFSEATTEALFTNYSTSAGAASITNKMVFNSSTTPSGYSNSLPGTADATIVKNKLTQLPFLSTVDSIKVMFATTTSSGTGDETDVMGNIKIYLNQSTTAFKSKDVTKKDLRKGYVTIPINKQYINNIQVGVDWTSVTSVGNISGITNDMMPWYAVLSFESSGADR